MSLWTALQRAQDQVQWQRVVETAMHGRSLLPDDHDDDDYKSDHEK